jgi:zinc protease
MKNLLIILVLCLALAAAASAQAPAAKSPGSKTIEKLTTGQIQLTIPQVGAEVERVALDNGLVLYLYEDHRVPIFNALALVRCGSIFEPADKDGLAGLVGTVMRTGGTKTVSGDSLNNVMEFIGGRLETGIDDESGTATLSVLAKDQDLGLSLLADLLRNPAFPEDKLDLAKTDVRNSIKRRNDDPNRIGSRYFASIIYGDHPFGREIEWATVKDITPQDLSDYHKKFFVPNNIMIGISGDFKKADVIARIKELMGDWPKSSKPLPPYPPVKDEFHPGVYQVHKDINQAYLTIGELGIKRDNPDRYAISLLNYILGGGSFTSRLTSRVRSDEGLAYHVGSSYDINSRDYGVFRVSCQTKSATAYKATRIITEEINKIRTDGVTPDELKEAKDATINRLVFNFDSAGKIVRNLMYLEFDGYPSDYYKSYLDNFRKVTVADIKSAAEKYLKPDQLSYIVVGKPDAFEKPLDEFGKITDIELQAPDIQ